MPVDVLPLVDLVDLLLLGAPGGKTEHLGGWVPRVLVAPPEAEARRQFVHLARQLYEWMGAPWNEKAAKTRKVYPVGRLELEIEGRIVALDTRMSIETWRAFQER